MGDSLIGLPCAEAASESRPEPVVSSDMRAARPESVCGSRSLRSPSTSSSPGSVASLHPPTHQQTATGRYGRKRKQNVHALQSRQHQETIAERVVLRHLVQSVAGIVGVDRTGKDGFVCHRRAERAAQPLLACVVVARERGQEPVRRARTAPQRPDGSGLPIDDSQLGRRGRAILAPCPVKEGRTGRRDVRCALDRPARR